MKSVALMAFALISFSALAAGPFAHCFGDHHGTYVDFKNDSKGVYLETSNDSDEPAVRFDIKSITKDSAALKASAYSWAIRQAIKANNGSGEYGMVSVKAKSKKGSNIVVTLNKYTGQNFIVVNDYPELATCPADAIVE